MSDDAPDAAKAKILADNEAKQKEMAGGAAKAKDKDKGMNENKINDMIADYKKKEE